ncbi:DUF2255 family protein [Actinacidiphila guanduensis]|uniref:DUF2255 family protein n=1 Tax=Actinacidiphila guanduensis TaxID=310781 RepID=A0A1H0PXU2_9ACTN|nr:DUF2255 family protein [Actinacidiphila guanduensis]SDP09854.1 hypothetical protein SAMN05216259_11749 [Actinacidiphila guanduensis]
MTGQETGGLAAAAVGDDVVLVLPRRTGTARVPVWFVVVDGEVYVRSYRGPQGWWYRRALAVGKGAASFGRHETAVRFEPITDEATNARISAAYLRKYARYSYAGSIVSDAAVAATVRLAATDVEARG